MRGYLLKWTLAVLAVVGATCAHGPESEPVGESWSSEENPVDALVGYRAAFTMSWRGARMGSAIEELNRDHQREDTLLYSRHERLTVRRGEALVRHETLIEIETDGRLRARRVSVSRQSGATELRGGATRTASGTWRTWFGDQPAEDLSAAAVPAELVGLLVAANPRRSFRGTAFMPGYGFATARLRVAPRRGARTQLRATAETPFGSIESHIDVGPDGTVRRMRDANGVSAARVELSELQAPFDPPELVDSASVALEGRVPARGRLALVIEDLDRARPPTLPGQDLVIETESSWHLVLAPGDLGSADETPVVAASDAALRPLASRLITDAGASTRDEEIAALARGTANLLVGDLSSAAASANTALALGRGDCTAHATLFAALAGARGIATRLVTGYRIDGARLVRHRWAIADRGDRWITVDPTYGEAPAQPRLIGLAVHGSAAADLAVVDTLAFAGTDRARARVLPWRD